MKTPDNPCTILVTKTNNLGVLILVGTNEDCTLFIFLIKFYNHNHTRDALCVMDQQEIH